MVENYVKSKLKSLTLEMIKKKWSKENGDE